jgi:hypothetical protein
MAPIGRFLNKIGSTMPATKTNQMFSDVTPVFTLKDIGSKIIDQLSTDVYTGPGPIIRELVKNAYDAYLGLNAEDFESGDFKREIVISREREPNGIGRLFIADRGIGQSFEDLKANVQISISRKPEELENATGFRGLGSWASLGAGSKITIASSKKDDPFENRLTIDVRKVYSLLSAQTTLDDILNNKSCIKMMQRPAGADEHYTTVEIVCDGPVEKVNGHELNRLYALTDPNEPELRKVLVRHCPVPFIKDGEVYQKIHTIYAKAGYIPTPIALDGVTLERRLPEQVTAFDSTPLKIGGELVAIAWRVHNPDATGELSGAIDEEEHNLAGPSIQLMKLNVPIGEKRIYNDGHARDNVLDWYVGEVHILAPDILPNASGDWLRDGTAKDAFITTIQGFYQQLEEEAEKKSQRISLARHFRHAQQAALKITKGNLTPVQESQEKAKVGKAVELLEILAKRGQPSNQRDRDIKEAAKDPEVADIQKQAKKVLKDTGLLDLFTNASGSKPAQARKPQPDINKPGSNAAKKGTPGRSTKGDMALDPVTFQARVGLKVPKLQQLGLTAEQIEGVLTIIQELFEGN